MAKTKIKQVFGFALAALLTLALTPLAAFAAPQGSGTNSNAGKITIDNAVVGQEYSIYQMLILESYKADGDEPDSGAYSYKANPDWVDWLKTQTKYVEVSTDDYVTWVENASVAEFAKAAIAHAKAKDSGITPTRGPVTATRAEGAPDEETLTSVSFEGLNLGYYLIDSSVGTLCALNTTATDVTITEKNDAPEVKKEVKENNTGLYGDENDAFIGDTVNFQTTITGQPGAVNYVLHDEMSAGLTFDANSVNVKRGDATLVKDLDYTLTTEGLTDGCTFEIALKPAICENLGKNDLIVVNYAATLNQKAEVGIAGNPNKTKLSYGEGANVVTTPEDETITYTWQVPVFKFTGDNIDGQPTDDSKALAGAQFTLTQVLPEGTDEDVQPKVFSGTSGTDGNVVFSGLDSGTYVLEETVAPNGYNKLSGTMTVTIDSKGKVSLDGAGALGNSGTVNVLNQSGGLLPSTGGIGTTILYVVGGVLIVGALVFLVVRRRQSAK